MAKKPPQMPAKLAAMTGRKGTSVRAMENPNSAHPAMRVKPVPIRRVRVPEKGPAAIPKS